MSTADCRGGGGQGVGKHFKGVENFLKRVAFNLGNTPSQTEVKIISCIPIDVSDLQQKILCLEKQLEDSKTYRAEQKRLQINTALCDKQNPAMYNTGVSCNMLDVDRGTNPNESFNKILIEGLSRNQLKRKSNVSFITPHESLEIRPRDEPETSYQQREQMNLYEQIMKPFTVGDTKPHTDRKSFFRKKKKFLKPRKPKTQFIYYAQTEASPFHNLDHNVTRKDTVVTRSYLAEMIDKQYKPRPLGGNLSEISKFSTPICKDVQGHSADYYAYESDMCSCCHGTFQNIDNHLPKPKSFRANDRITDGGYYDSNLYDVVPVKEKAVKMKKVVDMPKRREPKLPYEIRCWPEDVRTKLRTYPIYNPLYLNYHTVSSRPDIYYRKSPKLTRREALCKILAKRRMELDRQINIAPSKSCSINFGSVYPKVIPKKFKVDKNLEAQRAPRKTDAECLTNTIIDSECQTNTGPPETPTGDEKTEETLNQIKHILQSVLQEVKITTLSKGSTNDKPKKDAVVQKGVSQPNVTNNVQGFVPGNLDGNFSNNMQGHMPGSVQGNMPGFNMTGNLQGHMPGSLQGNMTGGLPCNIPGIVQGNMTGSIQGNMQRNYPINMTGSLQGNMPGSYINNMQGNYLGGAQEHVTPSSFPGVIPTNMNSSRLLSSCTYSPANLNPYLPSCSKHVNTGQSYCNPAMKCYHNFPLVVQAPGRQQCSCYRHSSQVKSGYIKQATTIATNTDVVKEEHSKETEKLIKEIYKSMALNMGVVHKDNSTSEYEPVHDFFNHMEKPTKKELERPLPLKEVKKVTNVVQAVSELFRKKDMQISSESPNTTTESRLVSNGISTGSQLVTTTTTDLEVKLRKDRLEKFLNQTKHGRSEVVRQEKRHAAETLVTVSDSETSSSDTETGVTYVPHQTKQTTQKEKKEKQSLFSKMFNSVKLFKPRERRRRDKKDNKADTQDIEESSSDSDDYQTIYSQKLETAPKTVPRIHNLPKRRTHSKISYKQAYPREKSPDKLIRRSPYLEQEFRRHWNEKLMFHDAKHRHSSEHPYSIESPSRKGPYYQSYEARTVCVDPRRQLMPRTQPVNARRVLAQKPQKTKAAPPEPRLPAKGIAWLKKHKMGIHCGEQWKKLILES